MGMLKRQQNITVSMLYNHEKQIKINVAGDICQLQESKVGVIDKVDKGCRVFKI